MADDGLAGRRDVDDFKTAFEDDEDAVFDIALVEEKFAGRGVAWFAVRHEPRDLGVVQARKHCVVIDG
jgi:hypothetical protein